MDNPQRITEAGEVFTETMHDLIQSYQVVRKRVASLFSENEFAFGQEIDRSLYSTLEMRKRADDMTHDQLWDTVCLVVRNLDLFGTHIENLDGSTSRERAYVAKADVISLPLLLGEVTALFEPSAGEKGVDINLLIGREVPEIRGDWALLFRMFSNLLDNAVKYSYTRSGRAEHRFIKVSLRRHTTDNAIKVTVESFGVGVTADETASGKLFGYGQRGAMARDRDRHGTGIGLFEAKRIVDAHEGQIALLSRPVGEGPQETQKTFVTTVEVVLPHDHKRIV